MSYKALAQDHRQVLSLTVLTLVPCRLRMFALFCGVYGVQRHMGVLYSGAQSSTSRVDGVEQAHCSRLIPSILLSKTEQNGYGDPEMAATSV